jgi:curved DNA-binding protein CbpA
MRRTWEWLFLGLYLPYRCGRCDFRVLAFSGTEVLRGPFGLNPSRYVSLVRFREAPTTLHHICQWIRAAGRVRLVISSERWGRPITSGASRTPASFKREVVKASARRSDPHLSRRSPIGDSTVSSGRRELINSDTMERCPETINGDFPTERRFKDSTSAAGNDSQWASTKPPEDLDCYEILQLSPNAESNTIERVYRILAERYHPSRPETGNLEIFLKLYEAHRILTDPELRAQNDARDRETRLLHRKIFDREGTETAEQRKRQAILELLYIKTIQDPEHAAMTVFEFARLLSSPREALDFALWYLKAKGYVKRGDTGRFTITASGADEVESRTVPRNPASPETLTDCYEGRHGAMGKKT